MSLYDIPAEFTDVNFPQQAPYVFGDCGAGVFRGSPCFEDYFGDQVIPQSQWPGLIEQLDSTSTGLEFLVTQILNQGNEGSCVAFATTQGMRVIYRAELGEVPDLSPMSIYRNIGSSPNSGSMVSDALEWIADFGVRPSDTPQNRQKFGEAVAPMTGFYNVAKYRDWPQATKDVAKKFRLAEYYTLRSVEGLMTALFKGWPCIVGRQGHSICYLRPAMRQNRIGVVYANSWGPWGFGAGSLTSGFGFDSESMVRQSASWAFCLRAMVQGG